MAQRKRKKRFGSSDVSKIFIADLRSAERLADKAESEILGGYCKTGLARLVDAASTLGHAAGEAQRDGIAVGGDLRWREAKQKVQAAERTFGRHCVRGR